MSQYSPTSLGIPTVIDTNNGLYGVLIILAALSLFGYILYRVCRHGPLDPRPSEVLPLFEANLEAIGLHRGHDLGFSEQFNQKNYICAKHSRSREDARIKTVDSSPTFTNDQGAFDTLSRCNSRLGLLDLGNAPNNRIVRGNGKHFRQVSDAVSHSHSNPRCDHF